MRPFRSRLLSRTSLALVLGTASIVGEGMHGDFPARAAAANPPAVLTAGANPPRFVAQNPCAARNPCNPCAAGGARLSAECVVPRLVGANPCGANPCGANPCDANPCAAKNPCAAANPCGASKPCNPRNPCGAATSPKLTVAEARAVYDCMEGTMRAAYGKSGIAAARTYRLWRRFSTSPYKSESHGMRFVQNYSNANSYGKFEGGGNMPAGTIAAKDSFTVTMAGRVSVGPLFLMEKKAVGTHPGRRDWQYTMIMPNGAVRKTGGIQKFCNDCHSAAGAADDYLMFLPDPFRATNR